MSTGSLSTLLNKFRYQERSKKFLVDGKQHADDTSMTSSRSNLSPSNSSTFATLSSPSLNSQDSDVTCIPETPTSLASSPVFPKMKERSSRLNLSSSDSDEECNKDLAETPKTSKGAKSSNKPTMRSLGERKFRLVSTGSEESDTEDNEASSALSSEERSTNGSEDEDTPDSSSDSDSRRRVPTGTRVKGAGLHSSPNKASSNHYSPMKYSALPSSSSDSDITTLGSHQQSLKYNPVGNGISDLETPPPTVKRTKKKRRRILSEGQESVDGGGDSEQEKDAVEMRRKEDVKKLKEMFPKWRSEEIEEVLTKSGGCSDTAASMMANRDSDSGQSDTKESPVRKRSPRKKRRRVEHASDKENSQWMSKSKMTAYFPKVTKTSTNQDESLKKRRPDKEIMSSEDDNYSTSSDSENTEQRGGSREKTEMDDLILTFFNEATPEELLSINHCSKAKVQKIISIRPYEDYDDLVSKMQLTKGLTISLVWNCAELFESHQVMTSIMDRCCKISDSIQTIVSKLLPNKEGEDSDDGRDIEGQITKQPLILSEKLVLKPYQVVGLNWLALMHRQEVNGILADEMGLGKTVQTIAFLAYLMEQGDGGPHLIVVPSSTLENWARELHTWCPALEVILYSGSAEERRELRYNILAECISCNVIVTSYNMCTSNADDRSLFRKMGIHYAVFDEAHMLKNMQSQRYGTLMKIRAERKLLLTGTPLQNNLKELISLLSFVMPKMFCDNAAELQKMFTLTKQKSENPLEQSSFERDRITHAKQIMQPFMLRRLKSQVLKQLPKKSETILKCPMIASQQECYNNIKMALTQDLRNLGDGSKIKLTKLSCAMMQLRKGANHEMLMRNHYDDAKLRQMSKLMLKEPTHYDAEPELIFEDMSVMTDFELHRLCKEYNILKPFILPTELLVASGKFQALDKMLPELKENGSRVLMFSQFVMVLDIIEIYMKHHQYKYLRLDGQTPVCDRLTMIDKYNNDESIFVFLLSTRAGGLGINLTAANHVILHDIDYNPYNDKQAEDRCHRVGQKRDVMVTKLISNNSIEEGMLRCAKYKLRLEEQMTTNEDAEGDDKSAADIASLLKDALDL
ncbi:SWI/SNF-related matrix-associated actin-dependent regulator of chromatin subfamily A containing DEAD/H box 1B-like isoform X2 [Asterias amurensis]